MRSWFVTGTHYALTFEDWLKRQDVNKKRGIEASEKDAISRGLDSEYARKTFNRFAQVLISSDNHYWGQL